MGFITTVNKDYIFEYVDNLKKGSLIFYYSGIDKEPWAKYDGIRSSTPSNIKSNAFVFYIYHRKEGSLSLKDAYSIASNLKPSDAEFLDIKVLGFSGGGEDIAKELVNPFINKVSFIGLADPSLGANSGASLFENLKKFNNKKSIRMMYGFNGWPQEFREWQDKWSETITKNGGTSNKYDSTSSSMDPGHRRYIKLFYDVYSKDLIAPSEFSKKPEEPQLPASKAAEALSQASPRSNNQPEAIPKSLTPNKIMPWFDEERYDSSNDMIPRILDSTTTVDGLIKILAEEYIFREDTLRGMEEFVGQVYKVIEEMPIKKYKVRVPGLHAMLPIPQSYGETADEKSKKIINLYPDFTQERNNNQLYNISVGDFVKVTFDNIRTFSGGKILYSISNVNPGLGTSKPASAPTTKPGSELSNFDKLPPFNPIATDEVLNSLRDIIQKYDKHGEIVQIINGNAQNPPRNVVKLNNGKTVERIGARNWRNNNPGNIEMGKFAREKGAIGTDGRFAIFPTFEKGLTALISLLKVKSYYNLSIDKAIARYAPQAENNTANYIHIVEKGVGKPADTKVSSLDQKQFENLVRTIIKVEGYKAGEINNV